MLAELDYADDQFLKKLFNYRLATNQNNYELMLDAREEFVNNKFSDEKIKLWHAIAQEDSIAN